LSEAKQSCVNSKLAHRETCADDVPKDFSVYAESPKHAHATTTP